jgi:type I restriction enzyme S subunit
MIEFDTLPAGWTIAKFEDLLDYIQPTNYIVKSTDYKDTYPTPVLTAGKSFIKGYTNETDGIFTKLPTIIFDDFTTATQFVNFPFKVKSSAMKILQPTCDLVNIKLAYYYMQTVHLKGETHKRFWISEYSQIPVPLAPLNEQKRILAKLEQLLTDLYKGIEYLETTKQQLKVYRHAVLKWAFEGKLTNRDVIDGELPNGWDSKKISQVAETFGGYAFKSGEFESQGKFQVIRMGNVRPGVLRLDESPVFISQIDEKALNKALLKVNDIIVTQTGTKGKRDYGFTALISKSNLLLNQRIAAIRCNEDCVPKFLLYYTWTNKFKDQFFANETGNVGQGNVGMKAVTDTIIWIPKPAEQIKVISEIESRLSVCEKIEESIESSLQQAEALRLSIIKKAFEGKLVPQDPNDEPAENLLERIRAAKGKAKPEKMEKVKAEKKPKLKRNQVIHS